MESKVACHAGAVILHRTHVLFNQTLWYIKKLLKVVWLFRGDRLFDEFSKDGIQLLDFKISEDFLIVECRLPGIQCLLYTKGLSLNAFMNSNVLSQLWSAIGAEYGKSRLKLSRVICEDVDLLVWLSWKDSKEHPYISMLIKRLNVAAFRW